MQKNWLLLPLLLLALFAFGPVGVAQDAEPTASGEAAEDADDAEGSPLVTRQRQVAERFRELERLMLRMAELTAPTDPRRAALLRRAVAQSQERAIDQQFETLLELLRSERLSPAVKGQEEVHDDLVRLLELLLSEDRSKHIESEKERIREYLKRVNKIIKQQRSVQGATQRDEDAEELAERQGELSEETGKLAEDVREDEEARSGETKPADSQSGKPSEGDSEEGEPSDKPGEKESDSGEKEQEGDKKAGEGEEKSEDKPSDGKPAEGEPSEGEKSEGGPAEGEESEGGSKPQEGEPQEGPPPVGPPQEGQPSEQQSGQQNPAQQRLEKAQQRMEEAQKKLEEAQKSDAVEKQEEALRELEQAKAELEEILRQLREEEMARTLAMLEARFRKMLDAQVQVYEGTQRLDKVPPQERDRDDVIEAGRLSRAEAEIAVEADKALNVLQEEGSAVAFPEAVIEIRDDMYTVRDRLAETETGELTQSIEQDIIAALEEMITALEKAQRDMQEMPPGQPGQGGGEMEMPLVDKIAELKMIRAMQMRVNNRTQRYADLTKTEQVNEPELLEALDNLAERQDRIHKITRDIVVGRNR